METSFNHTIDDDGKEVALDIEAIGEVQPKDASVGEMRDYISAIQVKAYREGEYYALSTYDRKEIERIAIEKLSEELTQQGR